MKKLILSTLVALPIALFSQINQFQNDRNMSSGILRDKLYDGSKDGYELEGSPFIYQNFVKANIENFPASTFIRYNAINDEIEIKEGNNNYVLPKEKKYSKIEVVDTNEVLMFSNYKLDSKFLSGYFFVVSQNDNLILLKKEKRKLTKEKEAKNSYEVSRPAKYETLKPDYYLKVSSQDNALPFKNKKTLIEILPEKKSQIEGYFKSNKIDFNNENDLKKLFNVIKN